MSEPTISSEERALLGLPHIRIRVLRAGYGCANCRLPGEPGYLEKRINGVYIVLLDRDIANNRSDVRHYADAIHVVKTEESI